MIVHNSRGHIALTSVNILYVSAILHTMLFNSSIHVHSCYYLQIIPVSYLYCAILWYKSSCIYVSSFTLHQGYTINYTSELTSLIFYIIMHFFQFVLFTSAIYYIQWCVTVYGINTV